jgi:hypothetical protein
MVWSEQVWDPPADASDVGILMIVPDKHEAQKHRARRAANLMKTTTNDYSAYC